MTIRFSEIADNPRISEQLANLPHPEIWSSALEIVLCSFKAGVSSDVLTLMLVRRHKRPMCEIREVVNELGKTFSFVLRQDHRDRFYWREPEPDIESMDRKERSLIEGRVILIHGTFACMHDLSKKQGCFTKSELIAALAAKVRMEPKMLGPVVTQILDKSRFLYDTTGGVMMYKRQPISTRESNMHKLRDIAINARW